MIKPGVKERALLGNVIMRIENSGLSIDALKMMKITRQLCEQHYAEHSEKPFFNDLIHYMTSGVVVAFVVSGPTAIAHMRRLSGATNPADATPGTIRGDLALNTQQNIIHASDSPQSAQREIALFFTEQEIM